jgi:hypothetical protein
MAQPRCTETRNGTGRQGVAEAIGTPLRLAARLASSGEDACAGKQDE